MADLKDFGVVKSWYEAYKKVNEEKKPEDEKKKSPVEVLPKEDNKEEEKQPEGESVEKLKAEIEKLKGELQKKDLEVKKKDAEVNVEPNPETGEVPLRVGIAQSILDKQREKNKKEKKEVKEDLDESTVAVYDVSYDDMPKNKLAQSAKKFRIRLKNLPRNKVAFGGDAAIEFSGSDSDLLKFFKQHFGSSARNIRDLKKELGESYEELEEGKSLNDLKKMLDRTTLLTSKEKKEIQSLEKTMGSKGYEKVLRQMFSESLEEAKSLNAVEYARKLASYAVKKGGIDKRDFIKIADRISNAKNDNDMKKIGDMIDSLDTEPRDLVQGSIALLMGPKTYLTMFGDRLTASDMNQYKKMTPRDMREESLDEGKVKEVMMTVHAVLKKEGGAAGFDVIRKAVKKEDGINITKDSVKRLPGVKMHKFGDFVLESKEETLDELKEPFVVVDTAQGNKVVGMASDEKEAQSIISSAERPPMRIKNKKTLKVVKVRKKQMIGRPLKEETLDEVNVDAKGTVTSKQIDSLKKAYNSLPDRIDPEKAMALAKMLDRFGEGELRQLTHADIKFISTLAINKLIMKHKYKAKDIHDIRKNKPKTVFD